MFPLCSSLLLLLLLSVPRLCGASDCGSDFRPGADHFVLDAEDSVREGAALLATQDVPDAADCEQLCCQEPSCNLALLEPRAPDAHTHACVLFDCVRQNRFVCRFVNQAGYKTYIRLAVFQRYLQGPGKKAPPIANAGRDVVVQPGETVLLNGSESQALHGGRITKYVWTRESGDPSILMENTELPDQVRLSNLQPSSYVFQLTVTDSHGQSASSKVTVLVLSPEQSSLYCTAPAKVGPCRAAFPRWRYNVTKGSCEMFTFGGCKPNKNNFLSFDECSAACKGVTAASERLIVPHAKVCDGSACRPDQLTCEGDCCLDRSLECDGVQHCFDGSDESRCTTLDQTLGQLLRINVSESTVRCTQPPRTGPCRAHFPRWYYDPLDRKCHEFTYGGCDDNGNNFEEDGVCRETCDGVTEEDVFARGLFDHLGADKQDEAKSNSTALAVILSVTILAVLAILGYCFLRSRKNRSRGAAAPTPGRVELSEQDTLVYNSTTKPL
ncbi:kunitz-type protease inhibitor 1 [Austrofundulus limnaeus]|uniref:Kunitz-type protease inhibitor 1 n=1 Tax=Austrofundulus limnaeus TaxID=52670 RepID=A0A2I4CH88_AUSLI|nr:PREDICTED: kunitz-type protease inhibitor 1-like [Austrofundulus limnaeus]